ncbi:MAG TPA: hypothetical protein VIO94_13625, partial [Phenylobacterium sp.]
MTDLLTLDPPYRLGDQDILFTFAGWCEVNDEAAPDVALTLNGMPVALETYPRPQVRMHFPGIDVRGVRAEVDFRQVFVDRPELADGRGGFLLRAELRSDHRLRTFEYAVSDAWMAGVFGGGAARRVPPDELQIRVSGAAAGGFF